MKFSGKRKAESGKLRYFSPPSRWRLRGGSKNISRGFTLIEILVAITIIAVIAAVGFASYAQVQLLSRDAKRKQDLRNIAVALELFRQKNGHYPCTASWQLSQSGGTWINDENGLCGTGTRALDSGYISELPQDPSGSFGNPATSQVTGYAYWSGSLSGGSCPTPSTGNYYVLVGGLENGNDSEANTNKAYKRCDNVDVSTNPKAFVIIGR